MRRNYEGLSSEQIEAIEKARVSVGKPVTENASDLHLPFTERLLKDPLDPGERKIRVSSKKMGLRIHPTTS